MGNIFQGEKGEKGEKGDKGDTVLNFQQVLDNQDLKDKLLNVMANDSRFSLSGDYVNTSKMYESLSNYQPKGEYAKISDLTLYVRKIDPIITDLNERFKEYQPKDNYLKYTDNKTLDLENDYINIRSKDQNNIASLGKNKSQFFTNVFMNQGINIGNVNEYVSFKKRNNCLDMTYVKNDQNLVQLSETLLNSWCESNPVSNPVSNVNNLSPTIRYYPNNDISQNP